MRHIEPCSSIEPIELPGDTTVCVV